MGLPRGNGSNVRGQDLCRSRAIRKVCVQFVALCRQLDLLSDASLAIDGAKFKAVNARGKNFTRAKVKRRMAQIEESVARYLHQLDSADRQKPRRRNRHPEPC